MAETPHAPTTNPTYERRDFSPRAVILFVASLAVLLVGTLALMAGLLDLFDVIPEGRGIRGAPMAEAPPRPPPPRLQTSPTRDMQAFLRTENERLRSYEWVDQAAGIARIPIERAMELVVLQGLPTWQEVPMPAPPSGEPGATSQEVPAPAPLPDEPGAPSKESQ